MTEEAAPCPLQIHSVRSLREQQQPVQNLHRSNQELLPYKNRLQEFTQRAKIPFPVYNTSIEGSIHPQKFKSTVEVDGFTYSSLNWFSSRKTAEQDAAKVALEGISKKINNWVSNKMNSEGFPPIYEERVICKMILHEYAAKMNLEKPKYNTVKIEGTLPSFVSTIFFGGMTFTGEACKSKKEAEQCAAREVILSILGNLGLGTILPEIIKAKANSFSSLYKQNYSGIVKAAPVVGLQSGDSTKVTETGEEAREGKDTNQAGNLTGNYVSDVPSMGEKSGNNTTAPETREEAPGDRDANKAGNFISNVVPGAPTQQACGPQLLQVPGAPTQQACGLQLLQVQPSLEILNCNKKKKPKRKRKTARELKTESCSGIAIGTPLVGLESRDSTTITETVEEIPERRDGNQVGNLIADDVSDAPSVGIIPGNSTVASETKEEVAPDQPAYDVQSLEAQPNLEKKPKRKKTNKKLKTEE